MTQSSSAATALLQPSDTFMRRHLGPSEEDVIRMLNELGLESLDALVDSTIPEGIRVDRELGAIVAYRWTQ